MPLAANEWAEMDKELASRERTLFEFCDGKMERMKTCVSAIHLTCPRRELGSLHLGIMKEMMLTPK